MENLDLNTTKTILEAAANGGYKYAIANAGRADTAQLQSVGHIVGVEAGSLKPGSLMMWNFGSFSVVVGVIKETPKQVIYKTAYLSTFGTTKGEVVYNERRFKKTRLVAIATTK